MTESPYQLGTAAASEAVIRDLYLSLRRRLFDWSRVTFQTPQPRMGYIGQHLTSAVTGFPGGRSGARGKDLVLPGGRHAEIKTCYRVDQLGSCRNCGQVVASVETRCPICRSDDIRRKDDSKWLINPQHDKDLRQLFDPAAYYLVLFDFVDLDDPRQINARIYRVDPLHRGFAYCLVDYYFNIKAASRSRAAFNLWPFSLKFQLMEPTLIYHARIDSDDTVSTLVFPGEVGHPGVVPLDPLTCFSRSHGFTADVATEVASHYGVALPGSASKRQLLGLLEDCRCREGWDNSELVGVIATARYREGIARHRDWLPEQLRTP